MPKLAGLINKHLGTIADTDTFLGTVKTEAKQQGITIKQLFWFLRLALMGQVNGPGIHELITILGVDESKKRIENALAIL